MEVSTRSPQRSMVWTEQKNRGKVPVVYYLSRNGQLEHPHFMEVTISSARGLHLRDVLNRLDFLRGKGMASMYSWSAKRNYKNGFVWHDLSDDDLIHPALGNEYILKGSELLHASPSHEPQETLQSSEIPKSDSGFVPIRRKNTASSSRSLDLGEYKVYKTDLTAASAVNADAATQTDDKRRRRRAQDKDDETNGSLVTRKEENPRTEISCDETSPPPSSSSPETLETLIQADGSIISATAAATGGGGTENCHSGRFRASASAVVMHLISCGSFSLIPPCRTVLQRGASSDDQDAREMNSAMGISSLRVEEKEYFSGSLVEMKQESDGGIGAADFPKLKRSSSYNAERTVNALEVVEKEADDFRTKCIPRKPKTTAREGSKRNNDERTLGSRGSKREEGNAGDKLTRVGDGEHVC